MRLDRPGNQIFALEAEFGVSLLERVAGGARLTAAGEILLEHRRRTLRDFDHVHSDIASRKCWFRSLERNTLLFDG